MFRWFLGGFMAHTPDLMVAYAPTINAYKRYQSQSWAPTRLAWSTDNRTTSFRIVGRGLLLSLLCDTFLFLGKLLKCSDSASEISSRFDCPHTNCFEANR